MKRPAHSQIDGGPATGEERQTTVTKPHRERAAHVRQAAQLQRQARRHRRLWLFYVEYNLFDEANESRRVMLDYLRGASEQWRSVLDGRR